MPRRKNLTVPIRDLDTKALAVFVIAWPHDAIPEALHLQGELLAGELARQLPDAAVAGLHRELTRRRSDHLNALSFVQPKPAPPRRPGFLAKLRGFVERFLEIHATRWRNINP